MANFSFALHRLAFEQVTYVSSSLTVLQSVRFSCPLKDQLTSMQYS